MKLFEDQIKPVEEVITLLKEGKKVLLYSPTGSGKTCMASYIVKYFNVKTLFLVNKQVLVPQSYETLDAFQIDTAVCHNTIKKTPFGVVMNDDWQNSDTVISLVETLENTEVDLDIKFIVIDEAHKSTSYMYQLLVEKYPNAMILGLSASPKRQQNKEGEALTEWYDVMVIGKTLKELIAEGRIAKPVYHVLDDTKNVILTWLKMTHLEDNKRTIMFTSNTAHSLAVKKSLIENGIRAEIITSGSELEDVKDEVSAQTVNQRNEIFRKFRDGQIDVLVSVNALCEGFDEKLAKYCFLLRKVGFVSLYHQMCGRVLRAIEGKPEGHIVDFAGNFDEFGPVEEYVWDMDGDEDHKGCVVAKNGESIHYGYFKKKPKVFVICDECTHVYDIVEKHYCPACVTKNTVTITASVKQLRDYFIEKIDGHVWEKFCSNRFVKKGDEFWHFFDIIEKAFEKKLYDQFNKMYCEIFSDEGFHREYSWMETIMNNKRKVKLTDKLEFAL